MCVSDKRKSESQQCRNEHIKGHKFFKIRLHNKFTKNYRKKLLKSFDVVYNNYIEMPDEKGGFAHEDYLFGSHT